MGPTLPSGAGDDRRALAASERRNALSTWSRFEAWRPVRAAAWELLEPRVAPGARVAVVGAGNCDDLPLERLAAVAGGVDLLDIDAGAARRARGHLPRALRGRVAVVEHDATGGAADRAIAGALAGRAGRPLGDDLPPLPGAPFDVVVGDLLYSQLLYPALLDAGLSGAAIGDVLLRHAAPLTAAVVSALQRSARDVAVHLHDPLGWWQGREQPHPLEAILDAAAHDVDVALARVREGRGPTGADPREALVDRGATLLETRLWRWPFRPGVDYLVCATVARGEGGT